MQTDYTRGSLREMVQMAGVKPDVPVPGGEVKGKGGEQQGEFQDIVPYTQGMNDGHSLLTVLVVRVSYSFYGSNNNSSNSNSTN